jgi:lambda family phage tail tape measure protein
LSGETIASLGLRVESSEAAAAVPVLDKLAASADRAAAAETKLAGASQTAAQAQNDVWKTLQRNLATADAQSPVLKYIQQTQAAQRTLVPAQQSANQAMQAGAISAKQYAAALRGVPAQLTDIVVGLTSGQSPLLVLLQQGGQLKDMFGGVGAAARALLSSISPTILAVGGLAAVGALAAKAFNDGEREAYEFQKAVVLSGSASGKTAGELSEMADQVKAIAGTRGEAADALNAAVSSGQIAGTLLRDIATAAVELQHAAGTPIETTIKQFAALGERPLQAAEALNKQTHFLTVELYEQIKALDEQGRTSEAAAVAQKGFLDAERARAEQLRASLGTLPKLWDEIKNAAANAWAVVARAPASLDEQISALDKRIANPGFTSSGGLFPTVTQDDPAALRRQRDQLATQRNKQQADARRAEQEAAALEVQRQRDDLSDSIDRGGVATTASQLQANLAGVQRALSASQAAYSAYEQAIESQHNAGLIGDREYYEERRKLIQADLALQVDSLKKENDTLVTREEAIRAAADRAAGRATPAKAYEIEAEAARQILELETKRKDNLTEIGVLTGKASADTAQTVSEEEARFKSLAAGYQSARDAAQEYFDTLQRRQQQELNGIGQGDRERQRLGGRENIVDRFDQQRRDLENSRTQSELQGKFNADAKKRYDEQLGIINEFQDKALGSYDDYWTELTKKQGSFFLGAAEGLQNYLDQSKDTAGQVAAALTRGLNDATDALVKFATTGKGNFRELANSIIADLLRIQLQRSLSNVLSSALGSIFGGFGGGLSGTSGVGELTGSTVGFAANGGDINGPTIVGERGPELIIPRQPATVIPNHALGGSSVKVEAHFHAAPGSDVASNQALLDSWKQQVVGEVYENIRRGRWSSAFANQ